MRKMRFQTARVIIPIGTSGIFVQSFNFDKSFNTVESYVLYPVVQDEADKFSFGMSDNSGVVIDSSIQEDHYVSTSVAWKDRYKELGIMASGNDVELQFRPVAALGAETIIDVVFKLVNVKENV